ncbi:hypothetical protein Btru_025456 [Bulinus truncatus]|nr:hypothetical protein Btru_025456 [Bulinus truncatus]
MADYGCSRTVEDDEFHENIYEKWLRRRLDYAVIRETGNHAAPGFLHTIVHHGDCPNVVASEIRHEMWRKNKYPHSSFFTHGLVLYKYPEVVRELLDLRFSQCPPPISIYSSDYKEKRKVHDLSVTELTSVTQWLDPLLLTKCTFPHALETPLSWDLRGGQIQPQFREMMKEPYRVNKPVYPQCCYSKDNVCSSVYCCTPLPEAVHNPGPFRKGDAIIKWHLREFNIRQPSCLIQCTVYCTIVTGKFDPDYDGSALTNGDLSDVTFDFQPIDAQENVPCSEYFDHEYSSSIRELSTVGVTSISRYVTFDSDFGENRRITYELTSVSPFQIENGTQQIPAIDASDSEPLFSYDIGAGSLLSELTPVGVTVI